ncbi:tRNA (guanosine(46)-N7)-methyltransferase TrmB [Halovulum dunhuangense]|uniref:tRNA (guanine-N(7)-)-methyltransferase n=1 Tax=Halovulum dunhuangense TaxID=1505036 RepID=A0A849KZP3_9RHOB|nr:tRNA (guanosine(46)-N7)-methyltransferase TrmB [Halovulum dunhuangense]NNU79414.1 tRNA (guanosine(46)-N7)-methyltransferase TrmB [Halovulum dunhuangense]
MSTSDDQTGPDVPQREDGAPWRNFYGRRRGKPLRKGQVEHLEHTLPRLAVPNVGWDENPARAPLDLPALFGRRAPLVLEIGFGGGEHLLALAARHPETDFIGCEPFVNGVAMLVPRIDEAGLTNVRLHAGDARDMLDVLPAGCLAGCYLLYPDPWPKKRHHRRRFVQPETLGPLSRALAPGAEFRVATDIPDYVRHTLEQVQAAPEFEWLAEGPQDWRAPWDGWHRTRYETKALREGRVPHYLRFRRR